MRTTIKPGGTFMGIPMYPDERYLTFNKAELATLTRAREIVEEARDRLAALMGEEWDYSGLYTLTVDDILDADGKILYDAVMRP